jgi:hypothetical protein
MKLDIIKILVGALLSAFLCPTQAYAVTACPVTVQNLFTGDDGAFWIFYTNGGSGFINKSDPDYELTASFALSALLASRTIIVRYAADGVACTASARSDLVGVYIQ